MIYTCTGYLLVEHSRLLLLLLIGAPPQAIVGATVTATVPDTATAKAAATH